MNDEWTYHRAKLYDKQRMRWHFVTRYFHVEDGEIEPRELYFRNDNETVFGMIRYDDIKSFPYKNWDFLKNKIISNVAFRETLLDEEVRSVWKYKWR